jgi:hypothetical protein
VAVARTDLVSHSGEQAVTLTGDQAKAIANCTRAFVFFATPHCGSSFADLAVVFQRFTRMVLDVPHNFLRDLCTKSPELYVKVLP